MTIVGNTKNEAANDVAWNDFLDTCYKQQLFYRSVA